MEDLIKKIIDFRDSRNWDDHDTPETLSKSIIIEAAELLENFQWGENISYNHQNVKDELADLLILILAMVHDLNLDVDTIIDDKLQKIAKKYPIKN